MMKSSGFMIASSGYGSRNSWLQQSLIARLLSFLIFKTSHDSRLRHSSPGSTASHCQALLLPIVILFHSTNVLFQTLIIPSISHYLHHSEIRFNNAVSDIIKILSIIHCSPECEQHCLALFLLEIPTSKKLI